MNLEDLSHRMLTLSCVGLSLMATAVAKGSDLDRVYDFLKQNVINRTVLMEDEGLLAEGTIGYVFRRELTHCNLVRLPAGLRYDAIYRITQENWDVDDGQKKGESRTEDRILILRYAYGLRRSTDDIIGHSHTLTATTTKWGGMTRLVRISLENDRLRIISDPGFYDDHFGPGGTFFAGASVDTHVWFVEDGKLVCETRTRVYRVDPKTLHRELLEDRQPVVEKETARLPLE